MKKELKPNWRAMSLVPHGTSMGNRWVCKQCTGKECSKTVALHVDPQDDWCKGGEA